MKEIIGRYAKAIIYTDMIDDAATEQIRQLCDQPVAEGSCIRIMPDVHAGTDCVIGFTANMGEILVPSLVGADIGCGVLTVELGKEPIDFDKLDRIIRLKTAPFEYNSSISMREDWALSPWSLVMGILRGGNHFIEVDVDEEGMQYLVIHIGMRPFGKSKLDKYQKLAYTLENKRLEKLQHQALIKEYKAAGREDEIEQALKALPPPNPPLKKFCCLTGKEREAYLHDMKDCMETAAENRRGIANTLLRWLLDKPLSDFSFFDTVHNYVDPESGIIRKGAVSAKLGEKLLIPLNMRDGCLLCIGKGNPDWNFSAPHGAGRLLSEAEAIRSISVDDYIDQMREVYTSHVGSETLSECPMAYKPADRIIAEIAPTVEVVKRLRPVYNYKASSYFPYYPVARKLCIPESQIRYLADLFEEIVFSLARDTSWVSSTAKNTALIDWRRIDKISPSYNADSTICAMFVQARDPDINFNYSKTVIVRKAEFYDFISKIMEAYLEKHPEKAEQCHADYAALVKKFDEFKNFQ